MQTAVYQSLGLSSTSYAKSSIKITVLSSPSHKASIKSQEASAAGVAAAAVRSAGRSAIFRAAIAEQPVGSLPSYLGFLLIASPALLIPAQPFGAGLTAQVCDDSGNVANAIGA
jgi:hypothetical protein